MRIKNIIKLIIVLILAFNCGCKKDACKDQVCFNGGACIDGDCVCVNGYTGTNCQDEPPCANITCFNNGICTNGTCDCPTGYSGTFCEIVDPCLNINCQNGGNCINGICNCPSGYTGIYCQVEQTPVRFRVNRVELNVFPDTNGPYCWDNDGTCYPDVYWDIDRGSSDVFSSTYWADIQSPGEYSWSGSSNGLPFTLYYADTYNIKLYDYDFGNGSDLVAAATLNLSDLFDSPPYPTTMNLISNTFDFKFEGVWFF